MAIGLAFQIADDILDIKGDPALLGKSTGMDQARGKVTYPAAVGLDQAEIAARELVNDAMETLGRFDEKADPLRVLANYIVTRKS